MTDLLEIPDFLKRTETMTKKVTITRPKLTMPSTRRVKAMKKENERVRVATKRAEDADLKAFNCVADSAETAASMIRRKG